MSHLDAMIPSWLTGWQNKTIYSAKCHIIWCPKYRRGVLIGPVETGLEAIIVDVVSAVGAEVIEV